MQLEQQLDGEVVEVAAVLDHLDERRQPALARRQRGDGDGRVELPQHCRNAYNTTESVRHKTQESDPRRRQESDPHCSRESDP